MTKGPFMQKSLLALAVAVAIPNALAADNDGELEHIQILSHYDKLRTEAGSATLLSEEQLEKYEYDDIHRILASVPGVNIREEDGYGLRPNIGFRGVTPERSKKITILEDGVLIGPSPYSAPAAYYFPVTTRMTAVEVFKGPAAIKYGPQTVAGTLNLITRQVPEFTEGGIDIAAGSDGYQKAHGYFGSVVNNVGFLLEGVNLQADGFKELDGGGNTGFNKNDLLAKFNYKMRMGEFDHTFALKLSYADEESDETYLGLTDSDFASTPYRRYAASQDALMETEHQQVMFSHYLESEDVRVTTRVYRNDYERAWRKLNGLTNNSGSLSAILANPEQYAEEYAVITGQQDSVLAGRNSIFLTMGTNDREYYSQGVQVDASFKFNLLDLQHKLSAGVRYHEDEIERKHFEQTYAMTSGSVANTGQDKVFTTLDTEATDAWSVYLENQITVNALTLGVGVRGELMDMHYQNNKDAQDWQAKTTRIWLPGLSGFYKLSDESGLLFGVHQGFVPSSPAQADDIKLEKSVNYEFGGRFNDGVTQFELVSFYNDYSNLKESCSQSNCGINAQIDQEFNGGEVDVYGVEAQFSQRYPLSLDLEIPYSVVYTYTKSEFQHALRSEFAQWGEVKKGDELPYLPNHQATFNIGLAAQNWQLSMAVKYISSMPEAAGVSWADADAGISVDIPLAGKDVPSNITVDLSASYELGDYGRVYAKVDNLLDETEVVSRRPYGARPGKPRQFSLGYKYQF
ncbi:MULTISPECIES: TonB-dependent receptor family protein [Pseudoalteromonas]|uniref:TonB-dependent receptor n=1 Tax=Pseudoalteromonas amylolytica TaxID=1859457 RepID=A0A1S1MUC7_9GAMM|nr:MULTISPECIES: TonB-dependent receptor [Pseudoalteromonas]OHU87690.1 TonB-dependent receptor [Pseudoalteromonas sp. JW3]OHU91132.1 TonB-dependent receptor [Pseudoalteromonas amylolytica]